MRLFLGLMALTMASPALAQETAPALIPAYTNAQACLQAHVGEAVRSGADGADAADFLLTYLCATEVDAAAAYVRNTAALRLLRDNVQTMNAASAAFSAEEIDPEAADGAFGGGLFGQASLDRISVDPVSGEIVLEDATLDPFSNMTLMQARSIQMTGQPAVPAFLRAYAGQLVVRTRR